MIGFVKQVASLFQEKPSPSVVQGSLFFQDESFGLSELPFDLLVDESHELEFDISDHAVENGSTISDHVSERLRTVSVTGMFTNHPIGSAQAYVDDKGEIVEEPDIINVEGQQAVTNTSRERLEKLKEIARRRNTVRLVTALEVYERMVIESVSFDRGPDDGESVKFTMKLREVRTARTQTKTVEATWNPPAPPKQETEPQRKLSEKKNNGKVSAVEKASTMIYKDGLNPQTITPKG
ncbi:phage baseplate protein [Fibrobacter sp. UWH4]|uniref:phage baseplate protein n=1 Tax=Fibrobacter sp. UWH4 TaxID=1896210 RepID=UPI000922A6AA|nr:hypothetical protein [Fibrobacter sp. UWH4]SHL04712.1 hypothetical protein SAMN05720762_10454 [Fibrobacter sp. UWH4]